MNISSRYYDTTEAQYVPVDAFVNIPKRFKRTGFLSFLNKTVDDEWQVTSKFFRSSVIEIHLRNVKDKKETKTIYVHRSRKMKYSVKESF